MIASGLWRFLCSVLAAILALVPLIIAEVHDVHTKWGLIVAFSAAVFCVHQFWLLKPDARFEIARDPSLDVVVRDIFRSAQCKLKKNDRLPFRVNIMRVKWGLSWKLFSRKLEIVYTHNFATTDPDNGIVFSYGQGLVWQVIQSSDIGWFDKTESASEEFNMNEEQLQRTQHVQAVLSLPLKRQNRRYPHAVLNFDALSEDAARDLRKWKDQLKSHSNGKLIDVATLAAIYV